MIQNLDKILDFLVDTLTQGESRRLTAELLDLDRQNREITRSGHEGFMFMGDEFVPPNARILRSKGVPAVMLDSSLHTRMSAFIADRVTLKNDKHQIKQVLFKLAWQATTAQEARDVLPECVVNLSPESFHNLSRQMNEGFLIRNDQRAMAQYEKVKPKIEYYAAIRLLF